MIITDRLIRSLFREFEAIYRGATLKDLIPNVSPRVLHAEGVMRMAHVRQFRKGPSNRPYAHHPTMLCVLVYRLGGDEETQIAALLHDVAEDMTKSWPGISRPQALDGINTLFGGIVARLVRELSNPESYPDGMDKDSWQLAQTDKHPEIRLLKAGDKLVNAYDTIMDPPKGWSKKKLQSKIDGAAVLPARYQEINAMMAIYNAIYLLSIDQ